ncbi:hypothetical protein FACS189449_01600 [Alphaproteobacteria bacterium]|nr:hypothetical protein FACS189449_01600 [Alphaproteobacteria bacterium]
MNCHGSLESKIFQRVAADSLKLKSCGLKKKAEDLVSIISKDPYQNPPPFEKLRGCDSIYSRRISIKHRLVYELIKNEHTILITP